MFLRGAVSAALGRTSVYGLEPISKRALQQRLDAACAAGHPAQSHFDTPIETKRIAYRYALMTQKDRTPNAQEALVSDHGLGDFPCFLVKPEASSILSPQTLLQSGARVLFLYRDLREVARSFAQFMANGKSRLLTARSLDAAMDLVIDHYIPVLARQLRLWLGAGHPNLRVVKYEDLMATPVPVLAQALSLPEATVAAPTVQDAFARRSWTSSDNCATWSDAFGPQRSARLDGYLASEGI